MDAVDVLILVLRLLFVVLLYLFLFVVLRTAFGALRPGASATTRSSAQTNRATSTLKLVVIEPGASALNAGEVIAIDDGATLGRSEVADVVLADSAISAEHARVNREGRRWVVSDLGSTNGTRVNNAVIQGKTALSRGDVLALGTVRLQVQAG